MESITIMIIYYDACYMVTHKSTAPTHLDPVVLLLSLGIYASPIASIFTLKYLHSRGAYRRWLIIYVKKKERNIGHKEGEKMEACMKQTLLSV